MGVLCSKEFRLKIGNPVDTSRLVYYKLDSYSSLTAIDSSQAKNLVNNGTFGDPTVIPALISNGYHSQTGHPSGRIQLSRTDAFFDFRLKSFCMRFWVYFDNPASAAGFGTSINISGTAGSINLIPLDDGDYKYSFSVSTSAGTKTVTSGTIPSGQWCEVFAWMTFGVEIGIRINNGAKTTLAVVPGWSGTGTFKMDFAIRDEGVFTPMVIDEMAIWKDYVLTDAQQTYDYNSGAGRTFPDVP